MTRGRNGSGAEVSVIQCLYASMFFLVCLFVFFFLKLHWRVIEMSNKCSLKCIKLLENF